MARKAASQIIALACFACLLAASPAAAQGGVELFQKAEQALASGDGTNAVDLYSQAIRSGELEKATLAQAFLQRGRAQQLGGQHARAVADFTNSLWLEALGPSEQARAYGWRGGSREALGQASLAKEDVAKAKSLDAGFAATPLPAAPAPVADTGAPAAASGQVAAAETSSSGGFLDGILSSGSSTAASAPEKRGTVINSARSNPASAPAASSSESSEGSSILGSGLISALFGSDEEEAAAEPAPTAGNVTVARLDPAPAAASGAAPATSSGSPDVLSRILTNDGNSAGAEAAPPVLAGGIPVPRAKPRATSGGEAPVRLASAGETPAPAASSSLTSSGGGIIDSLLGGITGTGTATRTPATTPETITLSESRVASAPPWTLGAANASRGEESGTLPPIPTVSTRNATYVSGTNSRNAAGRRAGAAPTPIAIPEPTRIATAAAPEPVPAPAPAPTPAVVPAPVRAAAVEPVPVAIPAPAPAPAPIPVVAAPEPRATNVAMLDWGVATEVSRAAPPPPPVPTPAPVPVVRSAPDPVTVPAPVARRAPDPVPAPVPVRAARRGEPAPIAIPRPVRNGGGTPAPAPNYVPAEAAGTPVSSRLFAVVEQAFTGTPAYGTPAYGAPPPPPPTPRQVAAVAPPPPVAAAAGSGGGYAIQVAAARTPEEATATAGAVARRHADLFGGVPPYVVRADIPGKGTYYRVRIGPYTQPQSVAAICQQLKSRGTDCFTVRP